MYCMYCGKEIRENAYCCPYCGTSLEIWEEDLPPELAPMGAWSYFGHSLLFSIPIAGTIILILFACGITRNINKRNYARSYFCGLAIVGVFILTMFIIYLVTGVGFRTFINYYTYNM